MGTRYGWVGLSEPRTEGMAVDQGQLTLCGERRQDKTVVTLSRLTVFLITLLEGGDKVWARAASTSVELDGAMSHVPVMRTS